MKVIEDLSSTSQQFSATYSNYHLSPQPSHQNTNLEVCPKTGEPYVAFNTRTKQLITNKELFSLPTTGDDDICFTSLVASELKDLFDQKFTHYKKYLSEIHKLAPDTIAKKFEAVVHHFFAKMNG